jgi:hypothetical protein
MKRTNERATPMNNGGSSVIRYLATHNCFVSKAAYGAGATRLTHTFLDGRHGGRINVPPNLVEGLLDAVASDISRGLTPPLNELKVDSVFHMFVDMDIKCDKDSEVGPRTVGPIVARVAAKFLESDRAFLQDHFQCIVLSRDDAEVASDSASPTPPTGIQDDDVGAVSTLDGHQTRGAAPGDAPFDERRDEERGPNAGPLEEGRAPELCGSSSSLSRPPRRVKRGIHLHFPKYRVTAEQALTMREAFVEALTRELTDVNWAEDIDNAPYVNEGTGLRVVGTPKAVPCPWCPRGKRSGGGSSSCCFCEGRGKQAAGPETIYRFAACFDARGEEVPHATAVLSRNVGHLVRATALRTTVQTVMSAWTRFSGCPSHSAIVYGSKAPRAGHKTRQFDEDRQSMAKGPVRWPRTSVTESEQRERLVRIFRTRFVHPQQGNVYAHINLHPIKYSAKDGGTFYCQFSGVGESFCFNVGRDHTSNRVYGIVTRTHCYVRCHSQNKDTCGRACGKACSEFTSDMKRLSTKDKIDLFGDEGGAVNGVRMSKLSGKRKALQSDAMSLRQQSDALFHDQKSQ